MSNNKKNRNKSIEAKNNDVKKPMKKEDKIFLYTAVAVVIAIIILFGINEITKRNLPTTDTTITQTEDVIVDETITETEQEQDTTDDTTATFDVLYTNEDGREVTHTGTITVDGDQQMTFELFGNIAPATVENFVGLASDNFYDGLIFHRVIENFMIQGGDPLGTGTGGSDTQIVGEFSSNGYDNDISHERGIMSMARSSANDSASSQFFIMHADGTYLDGSYAAFGEIIDGLDVIDAIAVVDTDSSDKPTTDVVITSIVID